MRRLLLLSLLLIGSVCATLACGGAVATCDEGGACPGRLVCDIDTGLCALPSSPASDEGPAGTDDTTAPTGATTTGGAAPPETGSAADPAGTDDDARDGQRDGDTAPDSPTGPPEGDSSADDGAGDGTGSDDTGRDEGQCIAENEDCTFSELGERDGCCESFHCCPIFEICVPNFWE